MGVSLPSLRQLPLAISTENLSTRISLTNTRLGISTTPKLLCQCLIPAFPGSYTDYLSHWAYKDLPVALLSTPVDLSERIYNKGYFIVIYYYHEHFFYKKSQFNFLLDGYMVFWIIGITDYTTLLHDVNTDFFPYGALWIRYPDCSPLPSPPDNIKKGDPIYTDGFKSTFCWFHMISTDNCNDLFHRYPLSFIFRRS